MEKLNFYDVNLSYINELKETDSKVPNIKYNYNNKFLCGPLFERNGLKYYAPVSSKIYKKKSTFFIKDPAQNYKKIGSVRLCFMIPVPESMLTKKDCKNIRDSNYKQRIETEYNYLLSKETKLRNKAENFYEEICAEGNTVSEFCCKFKELEGACIEYCKEHNIELPKNYSKKALKDKIKDAERTAKTRPQNRLHKNINKGKNR